MTRRALNALWLTKHADAASAPEHRYAALYAVVHELGSGDARRAVAGDAVAALKRVRELAKASRAESGVISDLARGWETVRGTALVELLDAASASLEARGDRWPPESLARLLVEVTALARTALPRDAEAFLSSPRVRRLLRAASVALLPGVPAVAPTLLSGTIISLMRAGVVFPPLLGAVAGWLPLADDTAWARGLASPAAESVHGVPRAALQAWARALDEDGALVAAARRRWERSRPILADTSPTTVPGLLWVFAKVYSSPPPFASAGDAGGAGGAGGEVDASDADEARASDVIDKDDSAPLAAPPRVAHPAPLLITLLHRTLQLIERARAATDGGPTEEGLHGPPLGGGGGLGVAFPDSADASAAPAAVDAASAGPSAASSPSEAPPPPGAHDFGWARRAEEAEADAAAAAADEASRAGAARPSATDLRPGGGLPTTRLPQVLNAAVLLVCAPRLPARHIEGGAVDDDGGDGAVRALAADVAISAAELLARPGVAAELEPRHLAPVLASLTAVGGAGGSTALVDTAAGAAAAAGVLERAAQLLVGWRQAREDAPPPPPTSESPTLPGRDAGPGGAAPAAAADPPAYGSAFKPTELAALLSAVACAVSRTEVVSLSGGVGRRPPPVLRRLALMRGVGRGGVDDAASCGAAPAPPRAPASASASATARAALLSSASLTYELARDDVVSFFVAPPSSAARRRRLPRDEEATASTMVELAAAYAFARAPLAPLVARLCATAPDLPPGRRADAAWALAMSLCSEWEGVAGRGRDGRGPCVPPLAAPRSAPAPRRPARVGWGPSAVDTSSIRGAVALLARGGEGGPLEGLAGADDAARLAWAAAVADVYPGPLLAAWAAARKSPGGVRPGLAPPFALESLSGAALAEAAFAFAMLAARPPPPDWPGGAAAWGAEARRLLAAAQSEWAARRRRRLRRRDGSRDAAPAPDAAGDDDDDDDDALASSLVTAADAILATADASEAKMQRLSGVAGAAPAIVAHARAVGGYATTASARTALGRLRLAASEAAGARGAPPAPPAASSLPPAGPGAHARTVEALAWTVRALWSSGSYMRTRLRHSPARDLDGAHARSRGAAAPPLRDDLALVVDVPLALPKLRVAFEVVLPDADAARLSHGALIDLSPGAVPPGALPRAGGAPGDARRRLARDLLERVGWAVVPVPDAAIRGASGLRGKARALARAIEEAVGRGDAAAGAEPGGAAAPADAARLAAGKRELAAERYRTQELEARRRRIEGAER